MFEKSMFPSLEHDFLIVLDLFGVRVDITLVEELIGIHLLRFVIVILLILGRVLDDHILQKWLIDIFHFDVVELHSFLNIVVETFSNDGDIFFVCF